MTTTLETEIVRLRNEAGRFRSLCKRAKKRPVVGVRNLTFTRSNRYPFHGLSRHYLNRGN